MIFRAIPAGLDASLAFKANMGVFRDMHKPNGIKWCVL